MTDPQPGMDAGPRPWYWPPCAGYSTWVALPGGDFSLMKSFMIEGKNCMISLSQRPAYCDRGNWLAILEIKFGRSPIKLNIDHADGWSPGRYYMDLDRAKLEIEGWMKKRGEWIAELQL